MKKSPPPTATDPQQNRARVAAVRRFLFLHQGTKQAQHFQVQPYVEATAKLSLEDLDRSIEWIIANRKGHCTPVALRDALNDANRAAAVVAQQKRQSVGTGSVVHSDVDYSYDPSENLATIKSELAEVVPLMAAQGPTFKRMLDCDHAAKFKSHYTPGDYCPTCDSFSEQWN